MRKGIKILLIIAFLSFHSNALAIDLTAEQKEEMSLCVKQKIDAFLSDLTYVANIDRDIQDKAIKNILSFFIGKGGSYEMIDDYGNATRKDGVQIQIAALRNNSNGKPSYRYNRPIPLKHYLNNLRGLPFQKIQIRSVDTFQIDSIYKTDDGRYQASARFCQEFTGYQDGVATYVDRTIKNVKIYITLIDDGGGRGTWQILFGDMRAESISK